MLFQSTATTTMGATFEILVMLAVAFALGYLMNHLFGEKWKDKWHEVQRQKNLLKDELIVLSQELSESKQKQLRLTDAMVEFKQEKKLWMKQSMNWQ
jgi:hypothetical protein